MGAANPAPLTAIQIFDKMIHYENDVLTSTPEVTDFYCKITQTTQRTGITEQEVIEKDYYFMSPLYQLYIFEDKPVGYFDESMLMTQLELNDLTKLRDEAVNGIPCYVIKTQPNEPAFEKYHRIYYVAQDDFRKIQTVSHHATRQYDELDTKIEYSYMSISGFLLPTQTYAETYDTNENLLATVTALYTDYAFNVGLTMDWLNTVLEDSSEPIPPLN
jgi:hypothetical protein